MIAWLVSTTPALGEVAVRGIDKDIENGLLAYMGLDDLPCSAPRWWVNRAYRQSHNEIRAALEAYGYYRPTTTADITWNETCWLATFTIELGKPLRVGQAQVAAAPTLGDEPALQRFLKTTKLEEGKRFTHSRYEEAKAQMLDVAESLGYFDADFTEHEVVVDPEAYTANVKLELDGGTRYRIGTVRVHQQALRPELFARYLTVAEGDPYTSAAANETYQRLMESGYYDRINIAPDLENRSDGLVDLDVRALAGSRRSTLVGAGFATDTGPRIRSDLRYRRVNDRGHRAKIGLLASPVTSEIALEYRLPYGDPTHQWLAFTAGLKHEDTDTSRSTTRSVGASRTQRRGKRWTETNYVTVLNERFDVAEQTGTSNLVLLGTSWSRSSLIDAPRPRRGRTLSLDLRGASDTLLSDTSFIQLTAKGKQIVPLGKRLRLLARATAGWTFKESLTELPPSIRFFAGGDNSVRGYGYEKLGPERDGEVIGGSKLLTGSVELDIPVRANWSVALFTDSGSAYDDKPVFSSSVGVGVRWYSPLGPLRLDVAHPLDDPNNSVRLHISLGPDL